MPTLARRTPDNGRTLYDDSIIVDATAPVPPFAPFETTFSADERVAAYCGAGVTLAVFTIVDDFPNSIEHTVKLLGANRRYFLGRPEQFLLADQASDVRRAKLEHKLAVGFAFQGSNALLNELALVEIYRRLGVIQMLLAYNTGNFAADGCHETRNAGLTSFGRNLVAEMNRVGMIVDVTHVGLRSSLEALELTTKPPVFSHSTPKKFAPHDRNITDEQIRACASRDGVICLSGVGLFMDPDRQKASASKLTDTIEYVAQIVGSRHVGIGLDYIIDTEYVARYMQTNTNLYGGGKQYPADGKIDFAPPAILPEITDELLLRGYSDDDVRAILGGNYLRVLDANL
jgi:membrane dipeptidase